MRFPDTHNGVSAATKRIITRNSMPHLSAPSSLIFIDLISTKKNQGPDADSTWSLIPDF
jgi:hypothetical protein